MKLERIKIHKEIISFNLRFKLSIVNDSIEYKNEQYKSDGYSLIDGKKSTKTREQIVYIGNVSKKS